MNWASWRDDSRFSKECGCVGHTVPCWLWMDRMDRARTGEHLDIMRQRLSEYEAAPSWLEQQRVLTAAAGVASVDLPRVKRKLAVMRRLGVAVIPDDLVAQVEAEWAARIPPPPEPPPPPSVEALRDKLREVALSVEMAANAKEKAKLLEELTTLDRQLRAATNASP